MDKWGSFSGRVYYMLPFPFSANELVSRPRPEKAQMSFFNHKSFKKRMGMGNGFFLLVNEYRFMWMRLLWSLLEMKCDNIIFHSLVVLFGIVT